MLKKKRMQILTYFVGLVVLVVGCAIYQVKANSDNISVNDGGTLNIYNQGEDKQSFGGTTADDWNVGGNLDITGTAAFTGAITSTGALTVSGETVTQGLTQGGGCLATSTSGSAETLTEATLLEYNCIEHISNVNNYTFTLPATSTMATLLPNLGSMREWVIHNATTTEATLTIAAGAGIDLIAVTTDDDVIDATEYARLTCWRNHNATNPGALDVACIVSELVAAD